MAEPQVHGGVYQGKAAETDLGGGESSAAGQDRGLTAAGATEVGAPPLTVGAAAVEGGSDVPAIQDQGAPWSASAAQTQPQPAPESAPLPLPVAREQHPEQHGAAPMVLAQVQAHAQAQAQEQAQAEAQGQDIQVVTSQRTADNSDAWQAETVAGVAAAERAAAPPARSATTGVTAVGPSLALNSPVTAGSRIRVRHADSPAAYRIPSAPGTGSASEAHTGSPV
jgi:hypothetical protein